MKYAGFYINLDRSPERRAGIEAELTRNGLCGYARFAAANGNTHQFPNPRLKDGEIGAFISHWRAVADHAALGRPLHIIEDDIMLSPQTGPVLDWVIGSGQLASYDIVYTDVSVPLLNDAAAAYKNFYDATVKRDAGGKIEKVNFSIVNMRELIFASMCSYLVNPASAGKLAALYERELRAGAQAPVDLYLRKLCQEGEIRIGCVFPFVTSVDPQTIFSTTMEKRYEELSAYADTMLRHSFFIGCEWGQCLVDVSGTLPQSDASDKHRQLMLNLLNYSLTPGYKKC